MNIANYDSTQDAEEATQHPFNGVELRIYSIDGKKIAMLGFIVCVVPRFMFT